MRTAQPSTRIGRRTFNEAAGADPADACRCPADRLEAAPAPSMRPRGQTPRMPQKAAAGKGAARQSPSMRPRGQTPRMRRQHVLVGLNPGRPAFNEAAGADPADAHRSVRERRITLPFNEAAGADPADARCGSRRCRPMLPSMRPRGQTPRMPVARVGLLTRANLPSMRPRGQTPRMPLGVRWSARARLPALQ